MPNLGLAKPGRQRALLRDLMASQREPSRCIGLTQRPIAWLVQCREFHSAGLSRMDCSLWDAFFNTDLSPGTYSSAFAVFDGSLFLWGLFHALHSYIIHCSPLPPTIQHLLSSHSSLISCCPILLTLEYYSASRRAKVAGTVLVGLELRMRGNLHSSQVPSARSSAPCLGDSRVWSADRQAPARLNSVTVAIGQRLESPVLGACLP